MQRLSSSVGICIELDLFLYQRLSPVSRERFSRKGCVLQLQTTTAASALPSRSSHCTSDSLTGSLWCAQLFATLNSASNWDFCTAVMTLCFWSDCSTSS